MTTINLVPPSDGRHNSISVDGRTYASTSGISIPVPDFDAAVLQANGWTVLSAPPGESWALKLRRIRASAQALNPIESPPLVGSLAWTASTAFTVGTVVSNGGQAYICSTAGTSAASGGPAGRGVAIVDNTAKWDWIGLQTAPVFRAVGTTSDPAITNFYIFSTNLNDNAGAFKSKGGVPTIVFTSFYSITVGNFGTAYNTSPSGAGGRTTVQNAVTTIANCTKLQFGMLSIQSTCSVIVDGRYLDSTMPIPGGTSPYYIELDWTNVSSLAGPTIIAGRQRHVVTLEFSGTAASAGTAGLYSAGVEATGTMSYPSFEEDYSVAVITDSVGYGSGDVNVNRSQTWPSMLRHLMGFPDMVHISEPGSGFYAVGGVNSGGPMGSYAIPSLLTLNAFRPVKYVFIACSSNDVQEVPATALQPLALLFFQSFRANFPSVPLFVIGCAPSSNYSGTPVTLSIAQGIENSVFAAVNQQISAGDTLIFRIPVSTDSRPWISGTGYVGNVKGDGNADFDVGSDGIHPSAAGHNLYARRLVSSLLAAIAGVA